jgi:hypothetical protein
MNRTLYALIAVALLMFSCGGSTSEAIRRGVGSECGGRLTPRTADSPRLP